MSEKKKSQIKEILNEPVFQKKLSRISVQEGLSHVQANINAETYLDELFTEHNTSVGIGFIETFQFLLSQGYDKSIDVDAEEIKQLAKVMRKHPVAFVLTHKSYIDLMVLSLVLARHGLPIPYLFAGINLDLFALGKVLRKNGIIFIRRSFKDNLIYKATLRHFITTLLNKQAHFMWALEGTRSRTGKLVWPQMGILKYIMEADQDVANKVKYVPVSIVFDLIPDVAEMTEEGRGKKKKPEDFKWMFNYIRKMSKNNLGKISLRIGTPAKLGKSTDFHVPDAEKAPDEKILEEGSVSKLAFDLIHKINKITPITTVSLVCLSLLSKFALSKRGVESSVANLMNLIESHKVDALVDRGQSIGKSVQEALNMLTENGILLRHGDSLHTKYIVNREKYMQAIYYANMSVHHFYHRAFIELALLKIEVEPVENRLFAFWTEIMKLRDFFKFEFFYSSKEVFTTEIEAELGNIRADWQTHIFETKSNIPTLIKGMKILVAPVILNNYIEAYQVVGHGLRLWDTQETFEPKEFIEQCLFLGEEMHWLGQIKRVEAVSKPFLQNGIRLINNLGLTPTLNSKNDEKIEEFTVLADGISTGVNRLQSFTLNKYGKTNSYEVPLERDIVPGSKTESVTQDVLTMEKGPHIGAFFDLDRTIIDGFSAKNFVKSRLLSGKFTSKELISQFSGVMTYATGQGNFASLAGISAKGVKGIEERVFQELGEEVYTEKLAENIFPEARALVAAHFSMGHTVVIVSAATPYQVEPIARDLGVEIIRCTRMEVEKGKFTGNLIEPTCWGVGKALAGKELAETYKLDLTKTYFYTDSFDDLPLLDIVGKPRPVNPDSRLSALAFQNDWPVLRFTEDNKSQLTNLLRTGLAGGILFPAVLKGVTTGLSTLSWDEGRDSLMASFGDLATAVAGIKLAIKGEENLWTNRPAVFILNHQSNADFIIASKLIRKQARGVAKMELQKIPIIGQIFSLSGTIFLDRTNKEKSIEALKPAVESLKNGTSIIIFPEGTRSNDYALGQFKKGAFHLAMEAGVPVIPIILKNAHDVMPKGKNLFNPTMVQVVVLPPIHSHDWTKENLGEKVDEIRDKFLEVLDQVNSVTN
ncbi:MAG: putative phosphoserine phosphatase/1-acylglycerol-3-phosphate O-acyltransferase [Arcticibacterium sp.]|jgi:putative phosphoserine phosphatase/1-acylglycerol-3-phosphate O-acyltransferase